MGFFDEDPGEELFLSTLAGLESGEPSSGKVSPFSANGEEDYLLDFEFLDDMIRGFEETSPPVTPLSSTDSRVSSSTTTDMPSAPSVIMPLSFEGRINEQKRGQELQKNLRYQEALQVLNLRLDELSRTNVEKSHAVAKIVSEGLNVQIRNRSDSASSRYPSSLDQTSSGEVWDRLLPNYLKETTGEARDRAIKMLKLNWIWSKLEKDSDSYWTVHERSNLQKILVSQVQQRLTTEALNANRTDMDALTRAFHDIEIMQIGDLLKLIDRQKVDWRSVASALRSRHSPNACERMWSLLDPNSNQTNNKSLAEWSKEEKDKLIQFLKSEELSGKRTRKRKNPPVIKTWEQIAAELPGRSPHECFLTWCRVLNPSLKVKERWSAREDAALLEAIRKYGIDWDRVCTMVPGRTRKQCSLRYTKSLAPQVRRGRWTPEEDAALTKAVEEVGIGNWRNVSVRVPGRTDIQCRERWVNVMDTSIRKGKFTEEEDRAILDAVRQHGEGKWSLVAQQVPGRTDNQCWRRFKVLQKKRRK